MTEHAKDDRNDSGETSVWSCRPVISLRGCGCCCSMLGLGCLAALAAIVLCIAAALLVLASSISFLSNLLFGAA